MTLPFSYIARNIAARRLTTALTAGGMALVVYVFATVLMLAAGLEQTLVATGQDDNVVVIRRARADRSAERRRPRAGGRSSRACRDIAVGRDGQKLVSKEVVVLINLPKRDSSKPSNVVIRGVTPVGLELRPQVKLVEGRMFRPGTAEVIAGRSIASAFPGRGPRRDAALRFAPTGRSSASSTRAAPASTPRSGATRSRCCRRFAASRSRRSSSGSPTASRFDAVKTEIESDPRLTLEAKRETRFYADQSEMLSKFISYPRHDDLRHLLDRRGHRRDDHDVRERRLAHRRDRHAARAGLLAHGDPRRRSSSRRCCSGAIGGVVGLVAASFMQALAISTMNFQTFAELAFSFTLTPGIVVASLAFALAMGFVGGFLPAARAARMKIVDALRAA